MRQTHSACTRKWTRNTRQGNGQSFQVGAPPFAVPVDDLMIRNLGHSIAYHFDGFSGTQDRTCTRDRAECRDEKSVGTEPEGGSREGIWWLPNETASDYLVLTNHGSNPLQIDLSVYDSVGKEAKQKIRLTAHATSRLSVRQLVRAAGLAGAYGGIKIYTPIHVGSLDSLHILFDEKASFSALMRMFDQSPNTTLKERDYAHTNVWTLRAPMLALTNPDPAVAFPKGTTLQPQLFVRNTLGTPVDVALRFSWRSASATGKSAGPAFRLGPYETRRIDVATLQAANTIPKEAIWASVILTTSGLPDEVVAVAASYDQTLQYGAQTPFSDQLAFQWKGSLWEYDAQHNSLITAGNGGTKPLQAAFTIYYNQGTQKYELEQTLQPDEQMWIDVGKLIREHVLDKNGNVLPADLSSGSYEFRDLTNKGIGFLFEGKVIFDKTYGHVTYGCASCCGYSNASLWYNPLQVFFHLYASNGVNAYNACDSNLEDVSYAFYGHWSSGNTGIATVDTYGTDYGVADGSTTTTTTGELQSNHQRLCPIQSYRASGNDNVQTLTATITLSPNPIPLSNNGTATIQVTPAAPVELAISQNGTGNAIFTATLGNTYLVSGPYPMAVSVKPIAESNGNPDLNLSASYGSSGLAGQVFSVTTGACTPTYSGSSPGGIFLCPSAPFTQYDTYNMKEYCSSCSFTCTPKIAPGDNSFTFTQCTSVHSGATGAGNQALTSTQTGKFSATDCNVHNLQIQTTITNAQGVKNSYIGGTIGMKCNANGSPACH